MFVVLQNYPLTPLRIGIFTAKRSRYAIETGFIPLMEVSESAKTKPGELDYFFLINMAVPWASKAG